MAAPDIPVQTVDGGPTAQPIPAVGERPSGSRSPRDHAIGARLFSLTQVQRAAWRVSRLVVFLLLLAVIGAGAAALGLRYLSPQATADYETVAAGGLMALAGIVPAVLAAVASGRPVTRLDGGRLMLRGSAGWVVVIYCLAWVVAFALPLLALVRAWSWLTTPDGVGVGLGLVVLSTLGTPIVFLVLSARLNPADSSLLAVGRAISRTGADSVSDTRARCDLVKDLRDLATTEHEAGDRRAVRYRMAALATIAAHARSRDVSHLALEELGLVCQAVIRDRDLAREGIALLGLAAESVPRDDDDLLSRVVEEAADIWAAAAGDGVSPRVSEDAARTAIGVSLRGGDVPLAALASLVREMGNASPLAGAPAAEQMGLLDRATDEPSVDIARLPSNHPLVHAWVEARSRLGVDGFVPLVRRIAAWTNESGDAPRSLRPVITAAANVVLSHTRGISLPDSLRADIKRLVAEGSTSALTRVAVAARDSENELLGPEHGVLFAELVRNWSAMTPAQLESMVTTFSAASTDVLLDRCAPSLLPRLDALVDPTLGKKWDRKEVNFPDHLQIAVARLLNRLRVAAVTRDPSLKRAPVLLEPVFGRLVDASVAGALRPEAELAIRKLTAAAIQPLDDEGAYDAAALLAAPAIPVMLASDDDYGPAWLLWWQRLGGGTLPARPSPAWCAGLAVTLLGLRLQTSAHDPATALDLPPTSVVAGRDWTQGEASVTAEASLLALQATLPSTSLGLVFSEIRRWLAANSLEPAPPLVERAARLDAALQALPSFSDDDPRAGLLHRHRLTLELWRDWVITRDPAEDPRARAARAGQVLRSAELRELRGRDNMTAEVLSGLAAAWCEGGGGPGRVDPDEAAAVSVALQEHWVVRATVAAVLRKALPSVKVSSVLLEHFADDLRTLARQVEMAVVSRHGEHFTHANDLLDSALSRPEVPRRQDRHLPTVARCVTRAMSLAGERRDGRTRDDLGRTAATLSAWGNAPDAAPGAAEAAAHLTAGRSGAPSGADHHRPAPPQVPGPRVGDPSAERTGDAPDR